MIKSVIIKEEVYRVHIQVPEGSHHGIYFFHKMGNPGHRIVANRTICNCTDYDRKRAFIEYYACKHMETARKLDFERLQEKNNAEMEHTIGAPGRTFEGVE